MVMKKFILITAILTSITSWSQTGSDQTPEFYTFMIEQYQRKIDWVNQNPDEIAIAEQSGWFQMMYRNIARFDSIRTLIIENGPLKPDAGGGVTRDINEDVQAGGSICSDAAPFCTEESYTFPMQTGASSESGPNYGCLGSQPNPVWYFMRINCDGDLNFHLYAGSDVDFICWGPFPDVVCDYAQLQAANEVDCSFSATNDEWPVINGAHVGDYYMFLITNYADIDQDFTMEQTGGVGCTDCSILFPSAQNNGPLCTGQTLQLTNTNDDLGVDPDFTWYWTGPNGFNSNDLNPVVNNVTTSNAGVYSLVVTHVTDGSQSTATTTVVVEDLAASLNVTDVTCYGDNNGSSTITLNQTGDYPNYTYNWVNSSSGATQNTTASASRTDSWNSLLQGNYSVTVTDSRTCTWTGSFVINEPPLMSVNLSMDSAFCGLASGQINVNIVNGVSPFVVSLTGTSSASINSATNNCVFPNLLPGNYQVSITDANGCVTSNSVVVQNRGSVYAEFTYNGNQCFQNHSFNFTNTGTTGMFYGTAPSYSWGFSNAIQPTSALESPAGITFSAFGIFTVTQQVSLGTTCSDQISHDVTIFPSPVIDAILSEQTSCYNTDDGSLSATISLGQAPFAFNWISTTGLHYNTNPLVGVPADSYTLHVLDANGCFTDGNATVINPTEIILSINSNPTICNGTSDGVAHVSAVGGTGAYAYHWSNGATGDYNVNLSSDIYSVSVSDDEGCVKIASVEVTQPLPVVFAFLPASPICIGESANLGLSVTSSPFSPYSYYWNGILSSDAITVNPVVTTTYSAQVIDANGCESEILEYTLPVYQAITASVHLDTASVCKGHPVNVTINVLGGNGQYLYIDETGQMLTNPFTVNPNQSKDYRIIVKDNCSSPADTIEFHIEVWEHYVPSFHADIKNGCLPLDVNFFQDVQGHEQGTQYRWVFGDSDNMTFDEQAITTFRYAGTYDVSLEVTTPHGCKSLTTEHQYINVFPIPSASFSARPQIKSIIDPVIYFENHSTGGSVWHWFFGDGDSTYAYHAIHEYANYPQDFNVTLVVTSEHMCSDTASGLVRIVDEITFYMPNRFSPNNDNMNETFRPYGNGLLSEGYRLTIYDRWGSPIFETNELEKGWDGRAGGNKIVQNGVYTYVVKYIDINKVPHEESGTVNLIR